VKTVWKYVLPSPVVGEGNSTVILPEHPRWLTVQLQGGHPVVWAFVDTESPNATYRIKAAMTGEALEPDWLHTYLGTLQFALGGGLVYHYFVVEPA
jgi:hypothetical protein